MPCIVYVTHPAEDIVPDLGRAHGPTWPATAWIMASGSGTGLGPADPMGVGCLVQIELECHGERPELAHIDGIQGEIQG